MISVREAVERAVAFATEAFPDNERSKLWRDAAQLEEVGSSKAGEPEKPVWLITLSVPVRGPLPTKRDYKTFVIDRETGEVLAMKIREFAGAHG